MKKVLIIALCALWCYALTACETEDSYQDGYDDGRYDGYGDGYLDGLDDLSGFAETCLSEVGYDIEKERGMHPEKAIQTLENYAIGEPIEEEELRNAIWTIRQYYHDVYDAIHDLDENWIY